MKEGQIITIIPSLSLKEMRLEKLVGEKAKVTQVVKRDDGSIKGCWAILCDGAYEGEEEWYFPHSCFTE